MRPGSAVLCSVEGSRPILVEVQALVSTSTYGTARRMASGIDQQRLSLLLAVLEKRAGLNLMGDDVFVNIAGGMTVDEPASDLGVLAAIASSVRNRVIPPTTAMFGEVGLAGEVRGITQAALRVREAAQMGFRRCIMPEANIDPGRSQGRRRLRTRRRSHGRRSAGRTARRLGSTGPGSNGPKVLTVRRRTLGPWTLDLWDLVTGRPWYRQGMAWFALARVLFVGDRRVLGGHAPSAAVRDPGQRRVRAASWPGSSSFSRRVCATRPSRACSARCSAARSAC